MLKKFKDSEKQFAYNLLAIELIIQAASIILSIYMKDFLYFFSISALALFIRGIISYKGKAIFTPTTALFGSNHYYVGNRAKKEVIYYNFLMGFILSAAAALLILNKLHILAL